jgi:nucleotide-binding universal stress UspA family protein
MKNPCRQVPANLTNDLPCFDMAATVMVPLDGSPLAEEALPLAVRLARHDRSPLHLITVHRQVAPGLYPDATVAAALEFNSREREAQYLGAAAERVRSEGVQVTTALRAGPTAPTLAEYAAEAGITLLVMTSHGHGGFSRFWLGSVAEQLIRQATVPVLCLKPAVHEGAPADVDSVRLVLIALDGSKLAEVALESALALAAGLDAEVELVRVVAPTIPVWTGATELPIAPVPDDLPRRKLEAQDYLGNVRERVQAHRIPVRCTVLCSEHVADAVVSRAREHAGAVIALATHRAGRLERVILGSVADKVLRTAPGPVLVCSATP